MSRQIWMIFWSKNDIDYLDVKLKVFMKVDKKSFRLVQNLTMGEADFYQFMRLPNQLVVAADFSCQKGKLVASAEQLELVHKVVNIIYISN